MTVRDRLRQGLVIPAHPLALDASRRLDERRQRALTRYYLAAGAGGIAVGVHTTQFAIHDETVGLLRPVLEIAREEARAAGIVTIAGVCGERKQAMRESELARSLGYDAALVSLAALQTATEDEFAGSLPRGGDSDSSHRILSATRSGRPCSALLVLAKVRGDSRSSRDQSRAVQSLSDAGCGACRAQSGRADEISLYTGNDDNIVIDLLSGFAGGLLGQWAVWTRGAVELLAQVKREGPTAELLTLAQQITDANSAIFDVTHRFPRMHSGNPRNSAAPGITGRPLVSESGRGVVTGAERRDRPRMPELSSFAQRG